MELIDLDEPGAAAYHPRLRGSRRVAAGFVAVAFLAVATSSAPGRIALGAPRWTAQVSLAGYVLGRDNVYVTEPGAVSVVAFSPGTGERRWRLPINEPFISATEIGGGVAAVVTRRPVPNDETGRQTTVTFVSAAAGERLSVQHGLLQGRLAGGLALIVTNALAPASAPPGAAWVDLRAVDPRTGRDAWSVRTLPAGAWFTGVDGAGEITVVGTTSATGSLELRSPVAGDVTGRVDGLALEAGDARFVVGDLLVVMRVHLGAMDVTAYRLPGAGESTGDPRQVWRWRAPLPETPSAMHFFPSSSPCGVLLCVHLDDGTTVLDPATGHERYRLPLDVGTPFDGAPLVALPEPGPARTGTPAVYVLDPVTGSTLATLEAPGTLVEWPDNRGRLLLMRNGPSRTEFVVVDATGHELRLGSVPGTDLQCAARGTTLACAQASGLLRVWRLPA